MVKDKVEYYCTKGIISSLPGTLIEYIMKVILHISEDKRDYLQVFKFIQLAEGLIVMEHNQEVPIINQTFYFSGFDFMLEDEVKVFVINNDSFYTMMLSSEY